MDDIIKVTKALLTSIFKKIKSELNNKANTTDVVSLKMINAGGGVAGLDTNGRINRDVIPTLGPVLEFKFVFGVDEMAASANYWMYIVYNTDTKRFLACYSPNSKAMIGESIYYLNWTDREEYCGSEGNTPRSDRLFVNTDSGKYYRWNGSDLVEVCQPLGEETGTAYDGGKGKTLANNVSTLTTKVTTATNDISSLQTRVTNDEKNILRAALNNKNITDYATQADAKTALKIGDVGRVGPSTYCMKNASGNLTILSVSSINSLMRWMSRYVDLSRYKTKTPFKDVNGRISNIYKGETVGNYTKWILVMELDGEDQTYIAGTSTYPNHYDQPYTCYDPGYNKPWELWLPSNVEDQSVYIQY